MTNTAASPDDAAQFAMRAVARDPAAWSAIFDAHYRSVFAFVRYRLRGSEEAEDIAAPSVWLEDSMQRATAFPPTS